MKKRKILRKFPHQFFFFLGMKLRVFLIKTADRLLPSQMAVYEKAQGLWISRALYAACELDLADHLAGGPKSIGDLAAATGTDETNLYRLMRTLCGEGVFRELPGRIFDNNCLSEVLKEGEGSMKFLILHQFGQTSMQLFSEITGCIRSGEGNPEKLLGEKIYTFLEKNPEKNEIYNKAMNDSSRLMAMALLSAYDFSGIRTLADVGGGQGILLKAILDRYQSMNGILIDQEHVADGNGLSRPEQVSGGRFSVVTGNFFDILPSGADAYLMKNILHVFDDEDCIKLLRKIRQSMAPGGRVIILETLISADNKPSMGKRLDLMMMVGTEGGKERTPAEFERLLDQAGLFLSGIIRTITPFSVIEAKMK